MSPKLHRMWFALAVIALVSGLWMFRYEPMPGTSTTLGLEGVWDRWTHRVCIVGLPTGNKMLCSLDEVNANGR